MRNRSGSGYPPGDSGVFEYLGHAVNDAKVDHASVAALIASTTTEVYLILLHVLMSSTRNFSDR